MSHTTDKQGKAARLQELQMLFWKNRGRLYRTPELAEILGVSHETIRRDLDELSISGGLPLRKEGQLWLLPEGNRLDLPAVYLTIPEAAALFVSARLLSQIQDERNTHVIKALQKLVGALPESIAVHQQRLIELTRERQAQQTDRSDIFAALATGWATHNLVRVIYSPPHGRTFEATFAPYLLEPSGIGRTVYALGQCTPPGKLRTLKLERFDHAELLKEQPFTIPADFDGPALLKRAWGVMYGDEECVEVRLRFSSLVEKRVRETLWHPSQQISDTPEGCQMTVQVGDLLEMENWIRGWGADCEVLTPLSLRESMIMHVRSLAEIYQLNPSPCSTITGPDLDLFSGLFEE